MRSEDVKRSVPITARDLLAATGGRCTATNNSTMDGEVARLSTDTRTISAGDVFVALRGENFDGHDFVAAAVERGCQCVIVDYIIDNLPAAVCQIVVPDTLTALGDIALWWRGKNAHVPLIAIVGSMGKTTAKEMLLSVVSEERFTLGTMGNLNNLIGAPLMLSRLRGDHTVAVLELGMNTPGELTRLVRIAQPNVVVMTNIRDAHVGNFESPEALYRAKCEALVSASPCAVLVLNADDPLSVRAGEEYGVGRRIVTFGCNPQADVRAENIVPLSPFGYSFELCVPNQPEGTRVWLRQFGQGHIQNALAAAAAAHVIGVSEATIARQLSRFTSGAARAEAEELTNGCLCIKDYYNASPAAMVSALESLRDMQTAGRKFAVIGDMMELGEHEVRLHREVGAVAANVGLAHLHVLGERGKLIVRGAADAGMTNVTWHESPQAAVAMLSAQMAGGDVVLIKASRLMRLEQVYEMLRNRLTDSDRNEGQRTA